MKLTKSQISYLKSLDSKKKKRKFLLDCLVENVCVEETQSPKPNYSPEETELVKHNINQREVSEQGNELLKFTNFKNDENDENVKWDMNKTKQSQELLKFDMLTRKHQLPFLTEFQKEGILKWMHDWEQLTNSSIPIRFLEYCRNPISRGSLMINNNNHLCWIFNRLVSLGENPNVDYMIKLKEIANKYNENAN